MLRHALPLRPDEGSLYVFLRLVSFHGIVLAGTEKLNLQLGWRAFHFTVISRGGVD